MHSSDSDLEEEAYHSSFDGKTPKKAFLYRKDKLQESIDENFSKQIGKFLEEEAVFVDRATRFFSRLETHGEHNVKDFIENEIEFFRQSEVFVPDSLRSIINQIDSSLNISDRDQKNQEALTENIKSILDENRSGIANELMESVYPQVFEAFFGESYSNIVNAGMVYALPRGQHKWSYNASWLRGHFNKGTDTFLVKYPIKEEADLRGVSSDRAGDFGSGFYREIAVCCFFWI